MKKEWTEAEHKAEVIDTLECMKWAFKNDLKGVVCYSNRKLQRHLKELGGYSNKRKGAKS